MVKYLRSKFIETHFYHGAHRDLSLLDFPMSSQSRFSCDHIMINISQRNISVLINYSGKKGK